MKKIFMLSVFVLGLALTTSCTRVAPNHYGVLMEDYGKNGKSDYSEVKGKVNDNVPGTELFQVPAWEQRAEFTNEDGTARILHMKASDKTEFTASPLYSYQVEEKRVVDVVFQNSRLGAGKDFMRELENNVLEPRIYDIIKEESQKYSTDQLMATGAGIEFEKHLQDIVRAEFDKAGLKMITFSPNIDFTKKVKDKINTRNEVNTNIGVLKQKIEEQKIKNELLALEAEGNRVKSQGLTPQILQLRYIEALEKVKVPIYGEAPVLYKNVK